MRTVDAVVIGGGPAGSAAAIGLARRGWRVVLLERGSLNRNKACGHCLSARAMRLLAEQGLHHALADLLQSRTSLMGLRARHGSAISTALLNMHSGCVVDRSAFDQRLRDVAASCGVEVLHDARATGFELGISPARVMVHTQSRIIELTAPLVVGADGLGSRVARAAGLAIERPGRKYGFAFDVPIEQAAMPRHEIAMFLHDAGYFGVVHRNGTLHCAGLVSSGIRDGGPRSPHAIVRSLAAAHPELHSLGFNRLGATDVRNAVAAGPMPWRTRRVAVKSVALVGDAAGYVEPFTGEGMAWAFQSAQLLLTAADRTRAGCWDAAAAEWYDRAWQRGVASRHRVCRVITRALETPIASRTLVHAGRAFPRLAGAIARRAVGA